MPYYCRTCVGCALSFQTFAKLVESALIRCPQCGGSVVVDFEAQGAPRTPGMIPLPTQSRTLHEEGFHPSEVKEARAMFGAGLADCITDAGDIVVEDSRTAKAFFARKRDLKQRGAETYAQRQEQADESNTLT